MGWHAERARRDVVSGRRDEDDSRLVGKVHCVGPSGGCDATHTHRNHVNPSIRIVAKIHGIADPAGDVACRQLDHGVPNPHRYDADVARPPQLVVIRVAGGRELEPSAGEDA